MKNKKVEQYQKVKTILFRLKTGCQWRQLPMKQFFRIKYPWQIIYYHFQKSSKDGSWERVWHHILKKYNFAGNVGHPVGRQPQAS
ncbi:transposase [Mariniphaga sp.]|uniref:transposase n=1 Tax=Mariniphaga sp. TaxID=1954475 RepID=UPI0035667856